MSFSNIVDKSISDPSYFKERLQIASSRITKEEALTNIFTFIKKNASTTIPPNENQSTSELKLTGLLFSVKDNISVAGHLSTFGSSRFVNHNIPSNSEIVKYLERLGACLIGATSMDDYALGYYGESSLSGRAINPISPQFICGGSSSGSALSVYNKLCDFSIGTDTGGSARIPAVACQLSALKLTSNSLPRGGTYFIDQRLDSFGLLTRELEDLEWLCTNILTSKNRSEKLNQQTEILIPDPYDLKRCDNQIVKLFNDLSEEIKKRLSTDIFRGQVGFEESLKIRKILMADAFSNFVVVNKIDMSALSSEGMALVTFAKNLDQDSKNLALQSLAELSESTIESIGDRFLLTPALPLPLPSWKSIEQGQFSKIPLNYFMTIANICDLPAIIFPIQIGTEVTSLQLIGPLYSEIALCRAARKIQESVTTSCIY